MRQPAASAPANTPVHLCAVYAIPGAPRQQRIGVAANGSGLPRPILRLDTVMAKAYVGGKLAPLVHRVKKLYPQF